MISINASNSTETHVYGKRETEKTLVLPRKFRDFQKFLAGWAFLSQKLRSNSINPQDSTERAIKL